METKLSPTSYYVLSKPGKEGWYLYTVEKTDYGKRIEWTKDFSAALIFSSPSAIEAFRERTLKNVRVLTVAFMAFDDL